MSLSYQAVGWSRQKKIYDAIVIAGSLSFLTVFSLVSWSTQPSLTIETTIIRAFGTLAFVLLHVVLVIGPLARLDRRFLPLLYNRRHLGVMMFLFALVHGAFAIIQFHTLGDINPLVSVLTGDGSYDSLGRFPFQPWGLAALSILLVMAATSHDFWLANLTPPVWKTIHMLVYLAYGFLIVEDHPHAGLPGLRVPHRPRGVRGAPVRVQPGLCRGGRRRFGAGRRPPLGRRLARFRPRS